MAEKFVFTRARLVKLNCPSGAAGDRTRRYVYDATEPGLCLMITRAGTKSFYLYRKINGRPERLRLGNFEDMSVDAARDLARIQKGEIAKGENPADERRTARGEMTFEILFGRYVDDYAKIHKRTWAEDQEQYERYLSGWKNRPLSDIDRRDVQRLHIEVGTKHGHYAANRLLALLSKVFSFARDLGFEAQNPAMGIRRFREQSRERFIQPDEMPRFMAALDGHSDPMVADFFRVLMFTGARRANVQAMKWADVNFARRTWTIPADEAKAGSTLTVYLSEQAVEVLQRRWADRGDIGVFVFPSYGKTGHFTEPKMAWKRILKRAGITDLRIHDLRRTYGSWLAAGGASLPMIGKALGHKSQQTTQIYARMNIDPIKSSIDAATAAMMKTAEQTTKKTTNEKATA